MQRLLAEAEDEAQRCVALHAGNITRIAELLLKERDLNAGQISDILEPIRQGDTSPIALVH